MDMASNDLVLLDSLLQQRSSEVGIGMTDSEYFELFAAEQVLKDYDLSYEQIEDGLVDGGGDGGIDSIYFFVNDSLYDESIDSAALKRGALFRLVIIQSKRTNGFSEAIVEKLISSTRDLFDLGTVIGSLDSVYNTTLLRKIVEFREFYLRSASRFPRLSFYYVCASRGSEVHNNVSRKVGILKETLEALFNPVDFKFEFNGAKELLAQARKAPTRVLSLSLAENPISTGTEGFVCLVTLKDYLAFISDENGGLRSYLFEGNVRDYQGRTEVNQEIRTTLECPRSEDFWWLNNGVSIICSKASFI